MSDIFKIDCVISIIRLIFGTPQMDLPVSNKKVQHMTTQQNKITKEDKITQQETEATHEALPYTKVTKQVSSTDLDSNQEFHDVPDAACARCKTKLGEGIVTIILIRIPDSGLDSDSSLHIPEVLSAHIDMTGKT